MEVEDEEPVTVIPVVEPEDDKSEAELRAAKVSDRQITSYWTKQERAREAQRVHQEDLTLSEKVLRYFDVSNQYGVSTTSAREPTIINCKMTANSTLAMCGYHTNEALAAGRQPWIKPTS